MLLGVIAAVSVVFFWSGWIVVSRLGVTNSLTVYDVAGFRFSVGAAVALPYIIWRRTWQGLTPLRVLVLTLTCGVPYALLSYFGFTYAPGGPRRRISERLPAPVHHALWLDLGRPAVPILPVGRSGCHPDRRHPGRL